jgi:hypothetical protein
VSLNINWNMFDLLTGWIISQVITAMPIAQGSDGTLQQIATTVRADILKNMFRTLTAERTLE